MEPFRNILLPTDFSTHAMQAADMTHRLARLFDASVSLVHVYHPEAAPDPDVDLGRITREQLDIVRLTRLTDIKVGELGALCHRSYPAAICEYAEAHRADLIVLGTHGTTGVDRRLLGDVAEKVMRHAPCSVLLVRPSSHLHTLAPRTILATTDFSGEAERGVDIAAELVRRLECGVVLLHVHNLLPSLPPSAVAQEDLVPAQSSVDSRLLGGLEHLRKTKLHGHEPSRIELLHDKNAVRAICDYAEDQEIDFVVVSSHGKTGIKHFLIGGVAEKVAQQAQCPVLLVRIPPWQRAG